MDIPNSYCNVFLILLIGIAVVAAKLSTQSWSIKLVAKFLKLGPVPRHVGVIMDGNRRYARSRGMKTLVGHEHGFKALEKLMEVCLYLGVEVVTVYGFSMANYNRKEEEVGMLMTLFREKFNELGKNEELVHRHGYSVRVIGAMEMLRHDVNEAAKALEEATKENIGPILNVACPYSSRHEVTTAITAAVQIADSNPITFEDIPSHLFTSKDPKLDLVIRTSGERRLSDFLLWQSVCDDAELYFVQVYWPQFSFWNMVPILMGYQARTAKKR
ncbi:Decaprenyl diphosphate synthase-like protein [Cladochytrium replicatum]|nr:Decaprenyl diphosphate synthase-like protein [Cladochytrium replicatum]